MHQESKKQDWGMALGPMIVSATRVEFVQVKGNEKETTAEKIQAGFILMTP